MKIYTFIILLFVSLDAFAQAPLIEKGRSVNLEPARSAVVVPFSSIDERAHNYDGALRYAIAVGEWERREVEAGCEFSSSFASPFSWIGREAYLSVESATAPYSVSIGGNLVGECYNPVLPAQFNVTAYLGREMNSPITITLKRDAQTSELEAWSGSGDEPELGRVTMLSQPTMNIQDVAVVTSRGVGALNASISIAVRSAALNPRTSRINYELLTPQGSVAVSGSSEVTLDMRRTDSIYLFAMIPDSLAWSAESPNLYRLNLSTQYRGRQQEYISVDLGFRSIEWSGDGELLVSGEVQSIKGCKVAKGATAEQLLQAKENGYNLVKFAAGEYNKELYTLADSIGLYVVATAPINSSHKGESILVGGNPTNEPERLGEYIERVDAIYNITKLHPSVVAYSIADESFNGFNLYESYLYLKGLDGQRAVVYDGAMGQWNSDAVKIEFE